MNEIVMPKLSDTMTEGRVVSWKKRVGEEVRRGEVLAEVETDKANMELEAFVSGVLLEIKVQAGELAAVGSVIALIGKPEEKGGEGEEEAPMKPGGGETIPAAQPAPVGAPPPQGREKAAPVVRRRARELGIDLSLVKGSGPDGRILLQDLDGRKGAPAEPARPAAPAEGVKPAPPAAKAPLEEGIKAMPRLRAAVAKTVTESWRSIPHFTVTMEIMMDDAMSMRRQLKESGIAVTVNDMVVKAVSLALQLFPQYNASLAADGMHLRGDVNVGVAVGVKDGVLIPVIQGCQHLSLQELSQKSRELAERARSGALAEQEMGGGTFSVSNLGMHGVSHFTAIIYPSHSGVLAVGAVADTVVVRGGAPAVAKVMKVTLCSDHRMVDGVYAAEFLVELKRILENPVRLLI